MNRRVSLIVIAMLAVVSPGCDSEPEYREPPDERELVPGPETPPQYEFAQGVRGEFPEVERFVREFIETCLMGDYEGYRDLTSRRTAPESRDRFQTIFHAMEAVRITEIDELDRSPVPGVAPPVYRVVAEAEFRDGTRVSLRGEHRDVAILVFREGGVMRMLPAPPALQPKDAPPATQPAPTTQPTTPDYPWDETGDY